MRTTEWRENYLISKEKPLDIIMIASGLYLELRDIKPAKIELNGELHDGFRFESREIDQEVYDQILRDKEEMTRNRIINISDETMSLMEAMADLYEMLLDVSGN